MKLKLNVPERLGLLQMLPKEGNYALLKLLRETEDKLSFTEEEHKEYSLKYVTTPPDQYGRTSIQIQWKKDIEDKYKEFDISDIIIDEVRKQLIHQNDSNKLHPQDISLYEKIVLNKTDDDKTN